MARRRWGAATFALTLLVGAGLASCHGGVHCGDTITADLTLTEDLINCPGDGLIIGADNVTIDLNSHVIDGDGAQSPANFASGSAGIRARDRTGVTVVGGTVKEFDNGVSFLGTSESIVRDLDIIDIANGVRVVTGHSNTIERNAVASNAVSGDAFVLIATTGTFVTSNRNDFNEFGSGLELGSVTSSWVVGNVFTGNDGPNIRLVESDNVVVVRNDASNSNTVGIELVSSDFNNIADNLTDSESDGISLASSDQNMVVSNDAGDVLRVVEGRLNTLRSNVVRSMVVSGRGQDVLDNRVQGNPFGDGIVIDTPPEITAVTSVRGNLVTDAAGDGIDVRQPNVVIGTNTALRNGDVGIRAVPGVVDDGGNTARDNAGPAQCINVTCA